MLQIYHAVATVFAIFKRTYALITPMIGRMSGLTIAAVASSSAK